MDYTEFKRGSEWRKWDLHIHTPLSYTAHFPDWEQYVSELKAKAIHHNISVMGVTDYFSIDGFEKLLDECVVESRGDNPRMLLSNGKNLYLIPVIELRLDNFTGDETAVNLHIAFSPKLLPSTIRDCFLENLPIKYQDKTLKCKESDLIRIGDAEMNGGRFNANLNIDEFNDSEKKSRIKKALSIITFSSNMFEEKLDDFEKLLNQTNIKKETYLLFIANKGHGGLSGFNWIDSLGNISRSGVIRQNLLNLSDICFSNSPTDKEFLLGKLGNTNEKEIVNRFRTLKPCIWGSDAHNVNSLFHPSDGNSNDYTWIKADPTFEGLKQIIYEPEKRVFIGNSDPNSLLKKICISKIEFKNSDGFPINNQELELNRDLVCIIGGRGSGKSALFESVAYCFDKHKSNTYGKATYSGSNFNKKTFIDFYKENESSDIEIILEFTDKDFNKLPIHSSTLKKRSEICSYPFLYLGQNQIEFFADNPEEIHLIAFDTILKQTSHSGDLISFQSKIQKKNQELLDINKEIERLRLSVSNYDEQKLLEDKKKVESELQLLSSSETKEIISEFNSTRLRKENLRKLEELLGDIETNKEELPLTGVGIIKSSVNDFIKKLTPIVDQSNGIAKQLNPDIIELKLDLSDFMTQIDLIKKGIDKIGIETEYDSALDKVNEKLKGKTELSVQYLESQKNKETDLDLKIETLKKLKLNLVSKLGDRDELLTSLQLLYTEYQQSYLAAIEEFNLTNREILKGIKMEATKVFNTNKLVQNLWELTDGRKSKNKSYFKESWMGITNDNRFELLEWYKGFIIETENFKVFSNFDINQFDAIVFSDYNSLETNIFYEIEPEDYKHISQLSLGQKGTVLLKFYLSSGNNCPILIDQPEDHLDNDFIYRDLVQTICDAKVKRQVIIVTHDANLVVNGDAEQVIIAHYKDQKIEHSLSGSLENLEIRNSVTRILEGGSEAFRKREMKYQFDSLD